MRGLLSPGRVAVLVALILWLAVPFLYDGSLSAFVTIALYVPIVVGLSLLAGFTGQVSLGQAAFMAVGAYTTGILSASLGWSPWLSIPLAVVAAGTLGFVIGWPVLLLRTHYLVVATLGLAIIVEVLLREQRGITGGANGLIGIPVLEIGGASLSSDTFYFYAGTVLSVFAVVASLNLVRSRFGRALQAIQSSETAAASLGISGSRHKVAVFAWSTALAGASGALYAHWIGFVDPSAFGVDLSVVLLLMAVFGGVASISGAILGTAVIELLREWLRETLPQLLGRGGEYELIVFGVLLALILIFTPEGVWPRLAALFRRVVPDRFLPTGGDGRPDPQPPPLEPEADGRGPILEAEGLTRRFGGLTAVSDVSFKVEPGEIFALIGPNGAGKTTLLNLVSGLLRPSEGSVRVAGRNLDGVSAHQIALHGVARTFQTPRLFPLLDVLDNVKTGMHSHLGAGFLRSALRLSGREERQATAQALGALEMVGIAHLADERVGSLPFGAQRLVELARAIASRPRLLLLDEPASGLTASERDRLSGLIRRIRDAGITVVLVEHNVKMVTDLSDRVVVIHHGERIADDAPEVVMEDPRVLSAYLGQTREQPAPERAPVAVAVRDNRVAAEDDGEDTSERGALLGISDLSAGYGPVEVLHGVSAELAAGETVALLGRNGAGKSTLMRAVTRLLPPTAGEVTFDGRPLRGLGPERTAALGLALVPEGRELMGNMSVADHLGLGAYRRPHSEKREVQEDLEMVYDLFPILADRSGQAGNSLSGGQQQMLAIARALMSHPKVLLLDEPLLGLAPKIVDQILETIQRLRGSGMGILVAEQNATAVLEIVDRGYVLETGRIVLSDTAGRLLEMDELKAAFLGTDIEAGGDDGRA